MKKLFFIITLFSLLVGTKQVFCQIDVRGGQDLLKFFELKDSDLLAKDNRLHVRGAVYYSLNNLLDKNVRNRFTAFVNRLKTFYKADEIIQQLTREDFVREIVHLVNFNLTNEMKRPEVSDIFIKLVPFDLELSALLLRIDDDRLDDEGLTEEQSYSLAIADRLEMAFDNLACADLVISYLNNVGLGRLNKFLSLKLFRLDYSKGMFGTRLSFVVHSGEPIHAMTLSTALEQKVEDSLDHYTLPRKGSDTRIAEAVLRRWLLIEMGVTELMYPKIKTLGVYPENRNELSVQELLNFTEQTRKLIK